MSNASMADNPDPLTELVRSIGEEAMTAPLRSPRFGTLAIDEDITQRLTGPRVCPDCHGDGKQNPGYPNPQMEIDCLTCRGDGEVTS